jgi:hypothetical protein
MSQPAEYIIPRFYLDKAKDKRYINWKGKRVYPRVAKSMTDVQFKAYLYKRYKRLKNKPKKKAPAKTNHKPFAYNNQVINLGNDKPNQAPNKLDKYLEDEINNARKAQSDLKDLRAVVAQGNMLGADPALAAQREVERLQALADAAQVQAAGQIAAEQERLRQEAERLAGNSRGSSNSQYYGRLAGTPLLPPQYAPPTGLPKRSSTVPVSPHLRRRASITPPKSPADDADEESDDPKYELTQSSKKNVLHLVRRPSAESAGSAAAKAEEKASSPIHKPEREREPERDVITPTIGAFFDKDMLNLGTIKGVYKKLIAKFADVEPFKARIAKYKFGNPSHIRSYHDAIKAINFPKDEVINLLKQGYVIYKPNSELARKYRERGIPGSGEQNGLGGGLYTDQIEKAMSKVHNFIGCVASDEFPKLLNSIKPHTKVGFISNIDTSQQSGSHWIGIVLNGTDKDPDAHSIMYYDPFGKDMPDNMQKELKDLAEKIDPNTLMLTKINRVDQQSIHSDNCGYFSMLFVMNILTRNMSFSQATGHKDLIQNKSKEYEAKIEQLKKQPPFNYIQLQKGEGILEVAKTVKAIVDLIPPPRDVAPPSVRKFLEDHKGESITSITVVRTPIISAIQKALNVIRKVTFQKANPKYDKMFHLYILMSLKSPEGKVTNIRMDRNEVFSLVISSERPKGESVTVASPKKKFGEVINDAVKSNKLNFFHYDAILNNCQDAVISILRAGGVLTPAISTFVKQDVKALVPSFIGKAAKWVTDKAHGFDRLLKGEGENKVAC